MLEMVAHVGKVPVLFRRLMESASQLLKTSFCYNHCKSLP